MFNVAAIFVKKMFYMGQLVAITYELIYVVQAAHR